MNMERELRVRKLDPWTYLINFGDDLYSIPPTLWEQNRAVIVHQHYFLRAFLPAFERLVPAGDTPVLDLGCNCGWLSLVLRERGYKNILGVDVNGRNIAQARLAGELLGHAAAFEEESIFDLARQGRRFHTICCFGVLNHLNDPVRFLAALHEITVHYLFLDLYALAGEYAEKHLRNVSGLFGSMACHFEKSASYAHPEDFKLVFQHSRDSMLCMLCNAGFENMQEICVRLSSPELYRKYRLFLVAEKGKPDAFREEMRLLHNYDEEKGFGFMAHGDFSPFTMNREPGREK